MYTTPLIPIQVFNEQLFWVQKGWPSNHTFTRSYVHNGYSYTNRDSQCPTARKKSPYSTSRHLTIFKRVSCANYFFCSTWHKLELPGKSNLNWENASTHIACRNNYRAFSWLKTDVGRLSPRRSYAVLLLGMWPKAVWESFQSKPESIILPCLLQFLSPGSCWLPSVMDAIYHVK